MAYLEETFEHTIADEESDVYLQVGIGDNQSLYRISVTKPGGRPVYDTAQLSLGLGKTLKGKQTSIVISVTDDNPLTNNTSVILTLSNGLTQKTFAKAADTDNGTVDYYLTIEHQ